MPVYAQTVPVYVRTAPVCTCIHEHTLVSTWLVCTCTRLVDTLVMIHEVTSLSGNRGEAHDRHRMQRRAESASTEWVSGCGHLTVLPEPLHE